MTGGHGFRSRRGAVHLRLDEQERQLLRIVLMQLDELVAPEEVADEDPLERLVGFSTSVDEPSDPALARLLPSGYDDDDDAAAEFRRYTEATLRREKRAHVATVLTCLDRKAKDVVVSAGECESWLKSLNDLRLVLGTRLGLDDTEPDVEEADVGDSEIGARVLYDWLTWLQATLIEALT